MPALLSPRDRALLGGAGLSPPAGFIFLTDSDGYFLIDSDGYFLVEPI